jgi:hypothetical protein
MAALGLLISWRELWPTGAWFTLAGLLLTAAGVITTYAWYVPAERATRALPDERVAAEAPALLQTLSRMHGVRMVFYVAGFVCFLIGALFTR